MEDLYNNTILIVDDSPENIDILVELLKDFEKKIAINGEDALKIAMKGKPPALILLDILMPGIDGYEVCRRLRANERTKEIPIIFLTVKSLKDDIVKGFEVGGQDYIIKPFYGRELIERVKTQIELKSQREILKAQRETLKNMNVILEEKVKKRTVQLKNALTKLDKASKELQGLDIAKNNFLHMISHEIRTPLNGIVGAAYLLKDVSEDNTEFVKFIDMLQSNVDRLENFSITALLVTQLQAGDYIALCEPHKTKKLINKCIESIKDYSRKQDAVITIDPIDPLWEFNVDEKLFQIALRSVIHNAIKYSVKNGKVKVKAYIDNEKTIIEVLDNGIGFTEELLKRIFQPFEIGPEHFDQSVGLSLYAAKMIMKVHNGDILIDNLPGSGAIVKLIFKN